MSYYSEYTLYFWRLDSLGRRNSKWTPEEHDKLLKLLGDEIEEFKWGFTLSRFGYGQFDRELTWYDFNKDLGNFTLRHPEYFIEVDRGGEESGDIFRYYICRGHVQVCEARISFDMPILHVLTSPNTSGTMTTLTREVPDHARSTR